MPHPGYDSAGADQVQIYKAFGVRTLNRTRTRRHERVRLRPVQRSAKWLNRTQGPVRRSQYFLLNRTEPDFRITSLWNLDTNLQVGPPLKHEGLVFSAAISADEKLLVTSSNDNVYVWDIHNILQNKDFQSIPYVSVTFQSVTPSLTVSILRCSKMHLNRRYGASRDSFGNRAHLSLAGHVWKVIDGRTRSVCQPFQ